MTMTTLQEILEDNREVISYHARGFVTNTAVCSDDFSHATIARCTQQLRKLGYEISVNIVLTKLDAEKTASGGV
jgi:hypothetical protein